MALGVKKPDRTGLPNTTHIVTFPGSPPNTAIYFCTQWRANRSDESKAFNLFDNHGKNLLYNSRLYRPAFAIPASFTSFPPRNPNARCTSTEISDRIIQGFHTIKTIICRNVNDWFVQSYRSVHYAVSYEQQGVANIESTCKSEIRDGSGKRNTYNDNLHIYTDCGCVSSVGRIDIWALTKTIGSNL